MVPLANVQDVPSQVRLTVLSPWTVNVTAVTPAGILTVFTSVARRRNVASSLPTISGTNAMPAT